MTQSLAPATTNRLTIPEPCVPDTSKRWVGKRFSHQLYCGSSVGCDFSIDSNAVKGASPFGNRYRIISRQFWGLSSDEKFPLPLNPNVAGMLYSYYYYINSRDSFSKLDSPLPGERRPVPEEITRDCLSVLRPASRPLVSPRLRSYSFI